MSEAVEPAERTPSTGLAIAIDLLEFSLLMRAERHRCEHPEAGVDEVDAVVQAWELDRPGAPHGDADGRSVPWPRGKKRK